MVVVVADARQTATESSTATSTSRRCRKLARKSGSTGVADERDRGHVRILGSANSLT